MNRPLAHVLLLAICAATLVSPAPAPAADPPAAVFDVLLGGERRTEPLAELAQKVRLLPLQPARAVEIGRDDRTSHHAVAIRGAEDPHRHDHHDLIVVIAKGWGTMRLGDEERAVGEGSVLYVPRGTPHAFRNTSGRPALAYAIYSPAFDGRDRVPVR